VRYARSVAAGGELVVFSRDASYGVGLFRHVFMTIWREPPTAEQLIALDPLQHDAARRCPSGFVALAVLPSIHARMTNEVREAAEHLSRNPSHALVGTAQVITGTGFVAATTRMIATGMALLSRAAPTRLFSSVEAAAPWVCGRVAAISGAPSLDVPELLAALAEL
jgi:hypothetical protein